jgi:hypothetical protein
LQQGVTVDSGESLKNSSLCLKRDCLAHFDPTGRERFPRLATIAAIGLEKSYAR